MKISYKVLGNVFTIFVLFLSTGAFLSLIVGTNLQASEEGSPLTQVIWAVVYLIVIVRAIAWHREILPLVRANKCLFSLILLAIVSTLWSFDRVGTLHHGVALLVTSLFGIDFALRYSIREQLRLVCIVLGSVILLSIAVEIFLRGLIPHVDPDPSIWQGVFGQKNTLGKIVVLAAAAFLSWPRYSWPDTARVATLIVIAGAVVIASHSASSLVELVAIVVISLVLGVLRWRPSVLIITAFLSLLIAIPTAYLTLNHFDRVTAVLGRDPTLTGRTEIWRLARDSIADRPLLGYGYDVFWEFSSQEATRIRSAVQWDVPSTHNGFMDLLLDVGFCGLLLFAVSYSVTLLRVVSLFRTPSVNDMIWPLLFLAEGLLCQITESSIVKPNSIYWILFVAIAISVTKPPIVLETDMGEEDPAESLPEEAVLTEV
ncbi:MAG: O-antigen ligase [Candidatus Acidiferrales bacterium]